MRNAKEPNGSFAMMALEVQIIGTVLRIDSEGRHVIAGEKLARTVNHKM